MAAVIENKLYSFEDYPEHKAKLGGWARKWIANAMSTAAMTDDDRALCEKAVRGLYEAAGIAPPKHIVFVSSPFVLRFAGGFAAARWHLHHQQKKLEQISATRSATASATASATSSATFSATATATDSATFSATDSATRSATDSAARSATDSAARSATSSATASATDSADLSNFWTFCDDVRAIAHDVGVGAFGIRCAQNAYNMWQGGNQWSAWDSFLTFFRHVAKLPIDYSKYDHWEQLSLHSGPRIVHPDFCMISDRPELLLVDAQNRPHCLDGPFCRWRDGSSIYAINGVFVPAWTIEQPERVTPEAIRKERNSEIRRAMVKIYSHHNKGANWLADLGAIEVDRCAQDHPVVGLRDCALWRVTDDQGSYHFVDMLNSTSEPDGTVKRYVLAVNGVLYGGRAGREAKAAWASTFRLPHDRAKLAFNTPELAQFAVES